MQKINHRKGFPQWEVSGFTTTVLMFLRINALGVDTVSTIAASAMVAPIAGSLKESVYQLVAWLLTCTMEQFDDSKEIVHDPCLQVQVQVTLYEFQCFTDVLLNRADRYIQFTGNVFIREVFFPA